MPRTLFSILLAFTVSAIGCGDSTDPPVGDSEPEVLNAPELIEPDAPEASDSPSEPQSITDTTPADAAGLPSNPPPLIVPAESDDDSTDDAPNGTPKPEATTPEKPEETEVIEE